MSKSIGKIIREARLRQKKTTVQIAAEAGVSEATVKRIERGWPPSTQSLTAVARALGMAVRVS